MIGRGNPSPVLPARAPARVSPQMGLTQQLRGDIRALYHLRWRPLAFPINVIRGVLFHAPLRYALRFRGVHRGQSRLQDLLGLLSAKTSLGTLPMKLAPRQLLLLGLIHCWGPRRSAFPNGEQGDAVRRVSVLTKTVNPAPGSQPEWTRAPSALLGVSALGVQFPFS